MMIEWNPQWYPGQPLVVFPVIVWPTYGTAVFVPPNLLNVAQSDALVGRVSVSDARVTVVSVTDAAVTGVSVTEATRS